MHASIAVGTCLTVVTVSLIVGAESADGPTTWPVVDARTAPTTGTTAADATRTTPHVADVRAVDPGHVRRPTMPLRVATAEEIEGYATRVSVRPGQLVGLKVSTVDRRFEVIALRWGWYHHGRTLRAVWRSRWYRGRRQPAPVFEPYLTRTVVAPWRRSLTVHTAGWSPGLYMLRLIGSSGHYSYVPLVIRSRTARGRVALVFPVATWQAYNDWGGYSLYTGLSGDRRSWAVSFDRPYPAPGAGPARHLFGAAQIVVRAARLDLDLAYLTDVDLDAHPHILRGARAYVSVSHDEYWTRGMRRTVTTARRAGTNLAFFGANTMYWRIRLADRATGRNRLVVGYRTDAALDPVAVRHPRLTTARWRDHPFPRPENSLTGMKYECYPVEADYHVVSPGWWGFRGTHVTAGSTFAHLVGIEADRVYPVPSTPRPLQILAHSPYSCGGVGTSAQSTYYTSPSGAAVFNAGTLRWSCALSGFCDPYHVPARTRRFVARVTDNVLTRFSQSNVGRRFPARDNVRRFHLPRVNEVPASKQLAPTD